MIISPKYDDFVKEMFHNQIIRRYFLGDILGISQEMIRSVKLRNTFLRKRSRRQKLGILDILLELNNNEKINIELQVKFVKNWDKRQLFYLARLYEEDLLIGENYDRLKKCIGISILDFNLTDRSTYHSVYRLRDKEGYEFSGILELHVIELKKELTGQGEVDDWIRFFNVEKEEDLRMIRTENPGILEAIGALKRMSMSNPVRLRYENYLKRVRDEKAREDYVREQGVAEGEVIGEEKGERLLAELMEHLFSDNRLEDAKLAASDKKARKRLFKEYGLDRRINQ